MTPFGDLPRRQQTRTSSRFSPNGARARAGFRGERVGGLHRAASTVTRAAGAEVAPRQSRACPARGASWPRVAEFRPVAPLRSLDTRCAQARLARRILRWGSLGEWSRHSPAARKIFHAGAAGPAESSAPSRTPAGTAPSRARIPRPCPSSPDRAQASSNASARPERAHPLHRRWLQVFVLGRRLLFSPCSLVRLYWLSALFSRAWLGLDASLLSRCVVDSDVRLTGDDSCLEGAAAGDGCAPVCRLRVGFDSHRRSAFGIPRVRREARGLFLRRAGEHPASVHGLPRPRRARGAGAPR